MNFKEVYIYSEKLVKADYIGFRKFFNLFERLTVYNRLIETLMIIHRKGYVHGDLHDGNIMMSPQNPKSNRANFYFKIIDFGMMEQVKNDEEGSK